MLSISFGDANLALTMIKLFMVLCDTSYKLESVKTIIKSCFGQL